LLKGLECQPNIYTLILTASTPWPNWQVVGYNALGHQNIVENPVVIKLVTPLACLLGAYPAPKKMGLYHLAVPRICFLLRSHQIPYKLVQPGNVQPLFSWMKVVVVVAYMQKVVSIVKNSYSHKVFS